MSEYITTLYPLTLLLIVGFGLIWGSFFNVCIARLPHDESIVFGGSHCPKCQARIPWYLNVPVVSYLWLQGRCRSCRVSISIQYPLVELATAALFLALFLEFGMGWRWLAYAVFTSILLVISVIDLHHQIIPNELSLPGILIGFGASFLTHDISWAQSLLGCLCGGGIFWLIATVYEKWTGREGLGGGDVKMLGMIGSWLGVQSLIFVIILSSASGSIVGLLLMALKGKNFKTAIPFGPFLALGALIYLFCGTSLRQLLLPEFP